MVLERKTRNDIQNAAIKRLRQEKAIANKAIKSGAAERQTELQKTILDKKLELNEKAVESAIKEINLDRENDNRYHSSNLQLIDNRADVYHDAASTFTNYKYFDSNNSPNQRPGYYEMGIGGPIALGGTRRRKRRNTPKKIIT